ncbi:MAG: PDZ domain-containing protein [bacterium]|nr:PDZ domain-containing protein [bacterium]
MIRTRLTGILLMLSVLMLLAAFPIDAESSAGSPFVRYPSLSPDGSRIAFCYQGDLWTVPASGGEAVRLTIHTGYDSRPSWSPGGQAIAFNSNRHGNEDIFVMPFPGGPPRQLTWHSSNDTISQWSPDNTILFNTTRVFRQVERSRELYSVSPTGGTPHRRMDTLGLNPVMSPDKQFIAFEKGSCRVTREAYRGPANRDIWLYDIKAGTYTRLTRHNGNDFFPRWGDSRTLYYISAQSGRYNIHSISLDPMGKSSGTHQVTQFTDFGVRYFNLDANGRVIVMERGTSIYSMTVADKKPSKVPIRIRADYRFDPVEHKTFTKNASGYAISPDGKLMAFVNRGEIFVKENKKEKSRSVNLTRHPYRDRSPVWLSDNALLFVSDRGGRQDFYMVKSADPKETNIFRSLKHRTLRLTQTQDHERSPVLSPDRKKIAFLLGRSHLTVADISAEGKISNPVKLLEGWAIAQEVSWSPDSKWLAYSLTNLDFNSEIYIHAADNSGKPVNVSMHPKNDNSPVWSPDGSKLAFISSRRYQDDAIWFAWLKKKDWEKTKRDWDEDEDEPAPKAPPAKPGKKKAGKENTSKMAAGKVKPLVIDLENIHERLVKVTALSNSGQQLAISKDGKTFYYTGRNAGSRRSDLFSITWDGKKRTPLTKGGKSPNSIRFDKSGTHLYFRASGGLLQRFNTKNKKTESFPFSAKMVIHHLKERRQIFDEATRALTAGFYDPNFHGKDWEKLKKTYGPMALNASDDRDFREMFNIMLGQLNASHMGLNRDDRFEAGLQEQSGGLLGIEVEPVDQGVRVTHVVPDSPAHRTTGKLNTGDVILSVAGNPIDGTVNLYSFLINKAGERVLMEVADSAGKKREVVIRPVDSLSRQRYNEWVDERKRLTGKYSNGRLGYLHIRSMGWTSFERFEREIAAGGMGKEGIVIDVRNNGGGWTTDFLMTILNVKQHAYTVPRGALKDLKTGHKKFRDHYPFGERLPYASWTRPSITLCNQDSYSNAEIFSHAFKNLGIGKLVGTPTFGAVISTGGQGLIDGSYVRMPYRGWFVKKSGENMEHGPAIPDIIVENPPDAKAKGSDPQLKRAVEELLKQIGERNK